MIYKFSQPQQVGDLLNSVSIEQLELASIAFNFEPHYSEDKNDPRAIISIVLLDRASGLKQNIIYSDKTALDAWKALEAGVSGAIWAKLIADKKLPAGNLG